MLNRVITKVAVSLAFPILGALSLAAASFTVTPVRVELSARQLHATLQITNSGDEKVTIQLHPVLWTLAGGSEALQDTNDVIFNPPIFTIMPHQSQAIRVGLREFARGNIEATYRLILEEVPANFDSSSTGLRTILRISIPIFVSPSVQAEARLSWDLQRTTDGGATLSVSNNGNAHIQLKRFAMVADGATDAAFSQNSFVYLLPGERKQWAVGSGHLSGQNEFVLQAATDGGAVRESLTLH
jgi:fimbrial chaperone protein